jgi:hypothetical protein
MQCSIVYKTAACQNAERVNTKLFESIALHYFDTDTLQFDVTNLTEQTGKWFNRMQHDVTLHVYNVNYDSNYNNLPDYNKRLVN